MGVFEACIIRIEELCEKNDIVFNKLSNIAGVTPSSIYSLKGKTRSDVGIVLIKKICDGFGMTLVDFFDHEVFHNLEQEIK